LSADPGEAYAREVVGLLGVPDFVYFPEKIRKGSGSREAGDGFLIAGASGVILQVKGRRVTGDSVARATAWCVKSGGQGRDQGAGTRRQWSDGGIRVTSLRGYSRLLPPIANWPTVVILDYPAPPEVVFEPAADTLFISLEDWVELNRRIRSTAGLVTYVERALASGVQVKLGWESTRYSMLASADAKAVAESGSGIPYLTEQRLSEQEVLGVALFGDLVDKVADQENSGWDSVDYLQIVEALDSRPVLARAAIGSEILSRIHGVATTGRPTGFTSYDSSLPYRLVFRCHLDTGIDGQEGERFIALTAALAALRHEQAGEAGLDLDTPTLAVGVLHNPEKGRRYNFAFLRGVLEPLPRDFRTELESEFGSSPFGGLGRSLPRA